MPVQVSRVIYLISIFNGTCNIYVTYYVTSRKDTFNRRFLGNWHARKSENSLESDCSNRTWPIVDSRVRIRSLIDGWLYTCIREISVRRYWSMEREVQRAVLIRIGRVPLSSLLCAIIRVLCSSLTVYRCILPRDLLISSSGDSLDATSFVDLPSQSSVFANCSRVDRPRRRGERGGGGEGGENSRRSSVTIRIFWAVFYTRTYIRFNIFLSSRAPSSPRVYRLTFPLRTVFLYFGIFFDFDAFTLFLAWTTSPCSRCICDIRVTT